MGLKERLGRLGPSAPVSSRSRFQVEERSRVEESSQVEDAGAAFARLREKMARELGGVTAETRASSENEALAVEGAGALPFVEQSREEGRLWQRLEVQALDHRVGRVSVEGARAASGGMLSLLALDPSLAPCDPSKAVYFDTETTGLGGSGTLAFLIGLAWFDEKGALVLEQLLLRDPAEEAAQLARVAELFESASMLVSFNGKSFDWPLLQSRRVMNHLPPLALRPHLDLMHMARRLHKRRLSRCRLLDLETEVLSFERGSDDIPGAEIPPLYGHFLRTGAEEVLRPVVDHNAWDVLSMAALVSLYGESLEDLSGSDLLGLAETLTRAKAFEVAAVAVGRAMEEESGSDALALRARLHRARGDKARALADFAQLSATIDDDAVRLELSKLYEHYAKDFESALAAMERGTGEADADFERRRSRLLRRQEKQRARTHD